MYNVSSRDYELNVFDLAKPGQPKRLARWIGPFYDLCASGNLVYITSADAATKAYILLILDLSDPAHPVWRGRTEVASTNDISLGAGGRLMVGSQMIDVRDPDHPRVLGKPCEMAISLPSFGFPWFEFPTYQLAFSGDNVFVAGGFAVLNMANPRRPALVGAIQPALSGGALCVKNHLIYLGDAVGKVIDISDVSQPKSVNQFNGNFFKGIKIFGSRLYTHYHDRFNIYDLGQPTMPTLLGSYEVPNLLNVSFSRDQKFAYLLCTTERKYWDYAFNIQVLDVSNPASPALRGQLDIPAAIPRFEVIGERGYLLSWDKLLTYDLANPAAPRLIGKRNLPRRDEPLSMAISGKRLFTIQANGDLVVTDLADWYAPKVVATYNLPFQYDSGHLLLNRDLIYTLDQAMGLNVFRYNESAGAGDEWALYQ